MSSKRGRKRNDALPPNRARDVQRAFRARRAAHLQALEQRVSELEEENGCLRQALNLPPSNRPPLGKGPTGKDKPKSLDMGSPSMNFPSSSRESSSADSPPSPSSSESPSAITVSLSSRPMTVIETSSWSDSVLMDDHHHQQHLHHPPDESNSPEAPYHLAPMSAPLPLKTLQYPTYNSSFPSGSSRPVSHNMYSPSSPTDYSPTSDRAMGSHYGFTMRGEMRDEDTRQGYSYTPTFQTQEPNMHNDSPSPGVHALPHNHPHRRSVTDPQYPVNHGFPHSPHPAHLQHSPRPPDYLRQNDNPHLSVPARSAPYGADGRLNPLS